MIYHFSAGENWFFTAFVDPADGLGLQRVQTAFGEQVPGSLVIFLAGGLVACLAGGLPIAWLVRRERAERGAAEAALAAHREAAADQAGRLELLDRRRAALAPIESLWLAWTSGGRPDEALLADAAHGLAAARLLFGDPLQAELEEAALLIAEQIRGLGWQQDAIRAGRRDERADLIDAEIAREHALKPKIAALRDRLADATRLA